MSISLKADPGGTYGIIQIGGVDKLRINSDGSLVALDPVASTDVTANRYLQLGDFGLGVGPSNINSDADLDIAPGLYFRGGSSTNIPIPTSGLLVVSAGSVSVDNDRIFQMYLVYGSGRFFTRSWTGSAWTSWREVYHQGSILGTVSESSGAPTGAVIERGSNANGSYTKLADGTMICTFESTTLMTTSIAIGSVFASATDEVWTFPTAFIAAPIVSGYFNRVAGATAHWLSPRSPLTTSVVLRGLSASSTATGYPAAIAIGRWF